MAKHLQAKHVERMMIHPTVYKGDALIPPICEGRNYKCMFCNKVGDYGPIVAHLQTHRRTAVKHRDYRMYRCHGVCIKSPHFHCCYCGETRTKTTILTHVQKCTVAAMPAASMLIPITRSLYQTSTVTTAVCTVSGALTVSTVALTPKRSEEVTSSVSMETSTDSSVIPAAPTVASKRTEEVTSSVPMEASTASTVAPASADESLHQSEVIQKCTEAASTLIPAASTVAPASTVGSLHQTSPVVKAVCTLFTVTSEASQMTTASVVSTPLKAISSSKVVQSRTLKRTCPHCNLYLYKRNLQTHIYRRHSSSIVEITAKHHLPSQCLDRKKGIFAVGRTFYGLRNPIHVQKLTWGNSHQVVCELETCQQASEFSRRSGLLGFMCIHLRSLIYCPASSKPDVTLKEEVLSEMVGKKLISDNTKKMCLVKKEQAQSENSPLTKEVTFCSGPKRVYVSVLDTCTSDYSRLGRVHVCYDIRKKSWHCPCSKPKKSCAHKSIAKWHLNQTRPELFLKVLSKEMFEMFSESDTEGHIFDIQR